ncbi:helix-turn-helix transcriptional regulator [Brachybacterium alimentarium]|uniref:helix-turn-helix transcriptional regulator n=1 Tax=Brachybacterium alimentarium TaxID=47845 RepID=UPI000DF2EF06|nr:helix-turn-helix transcriptional regulator [Brachybacterium alimentarium]RCS82599.1 AraC family transcriptional regulator [Brachybacterium alimentarium]
MSQRALRGYQVLLARTQTVHRPVGPLAYDCVKVIIVRDGSAILFSEFGQKPVRPGDVVVLGPNVLCGSEPEGHITVTTIYADTDYVIDQAFWQYAAILHDRLDAPGFVREAFTDPAQIIRLGEERAGLLMPWLDELVALSVDGELERFHRTQALWFAIMDRIAPYLHVTDHRISPSQRARVVPVHPRVRRFAPTRSEAAEVREALMGAIAYSWTLGELAEGVHLSTKQLARVFSNAYGKTPQAFLTMLRVEEMARLLRETNLTIEQAAQRVGWRSRNRASIAFTRATGMTPSAYRALRVTGNQHPA